MAASQRRAGFSPRAAGLTLAGLLAMAVVAGCATGDISMLVQVSSGEKVHVPLGRNGPVFTEADGVKIVTVGSAPDASKKNLIYTFEFSDERSRALQRVKVEDVTDDLSAVLVDDSSPAETNGHWRQVSRTLGPDDEALKWVYTLENTVRIFRFTLVFADGRKLVLDQGSVYPNPIKIGIRHMFGKEY